MTDQEKRVVVFGWPAEGEGVWVLRYACWREVPGDFGRVGMARDMQERIRVMREYGAAFVEEEGEVEELSDGYGMPKTARGGMEGQECSTEQESPD